MTFANTRIGSRLALGFTLILLLVAMIAGIGIWRLQQTGKAVEVMVSQYLLRERLATQWESAVTINSVRTIALTRSDYIKTQESFSAQMKATSERATELQNRLQSLVNDQGRQGLAEIAAARESYVEIRKSLLASRKSVTPEETNLLIEQKMMPALNEYQSRLRKFVELQQAEIDAAALKINANYRSGRMLLILLGMSAMIAGALLAWRLTVGIVNPLNAAVRVARRVAQGDLSSVIEVRSTDETGQLLLAVKEMNAALAHTVSRVRAGTETIVAASRQIAAGNLDLSSRTEAQAASLEQTAASMEQLTATVKQNADNARQANQLAESASAVAQSGGRMVADAVETMVVIQDSSRKIVDIIGVIEGIAFQTNILALNAAVEAARAGDQGRGFAVVATEVRHLAKRAAAAAKDIKSLINDSVEKVDAGSKQVGEVGRTMTDIVGSIKHVVNIMAEITVASEDQRSGIEQVNQAVGQMDQVTQQNAALVEEAAAAAHSLQEQAEELLQAVHIFRLANRSENGDPANVERQDVVSSATNHQSSTITENKTTALVFPL